MTYYIALNKNQLSRMRHDRFWGLSIGHIGDGDLDEAVQTLKNNPVKLVTIISQMDAVWTMWWPVRALYWMFNINDYRKNHYTLQCYIALDLYEQDIKMQSESVQNKNKTHREAAFLVNSDNPKMTIGIAGYFSSSTMQAALRRNMIWFGEQISPWLPSWNSTHTSTQQQDNQDESDETNLEHQFDVKQTMLPCMMTLGLTTFNAGDPCSFQIIKKAYHHSLRLTHPDKGGTSEAFRAAQSAFKDLMTMIEQTHSQDREFVAYTSCFYERQTVSVNRYSNNVERYCNNVERYCNNVTQLGKDVTRIGDDLEELGESLKKMGDDLTDLKKEFAQERKEMEAKWAAEGLSPLTEEEVQAFINDPDYFMQQNELECMLSFDYDAPPTPLTSQSVNRYSFHHPVTQVNNASSRLDSQSQHTNLTRVANT